MIPRQPKKAPLISRIVGGVLIVEGVLLLGSYFVWHNLNKSRDFRKTAQKDYPWILDKFYWIGEKADKTYALRVLDQRAWSAEERAQNPTPK